MFVCFFAGGARRPREAHPETEAYQPVRQHDEPREDQVQAVRHA